jgi:quercetin dioxygenase-like cupin family protein
VEALKGEAQEEQMDSSTKSTREPARDRFAPSELLLDLNESARLLLEELHEGQHGHRQIALYKANHTTIALFVFEAGGHMPRHQTRGTVLVQVLAGKLKVTAPEGAHIVGAGQVLVLAPNVPHDVVAEEPSQMLLTVAMG